MNNPRSENRPRFGFVHDINREPMSISERRKTKTMTPVVVIPMPFAGKRAQARVRRLWRDYWWPMG